MTYESEQSMQEMVRAISFVLEENTLKKVCASPYYSIVLDESTDLSTLKQLGVVVHYLDMDTASPVCQYVKLLEIASVHATADVVTSLITHYLEDHAAPAPGLCQLAGASCDGASVMMGPENGVMARLKMKVPDLIVTHCSAHRLALAASDTARQFS